MKAPAREQRQEWTPPPLVGYPTASPTPGSKNKYAVASCMPRHREHTGQARLQASIVALS